MKSRLPNVERTRTPLAAAASLALVAAVGVWAWEQARFWSSEPVRKTNLAHVEDAARQDSDRVAALADEVERQTSASLARTRRQRAASIVALGAAAIAIALVRTRRGSTIELPACIQSRRPPPMEAETAATQDPRYAPPHHEHDPPAEAPVDLAPLEEIVARVGREPRHLIPLLHAVDRHYRYLPPAALARLPALVDVTAAQIAGVASFYSQFRTRPCGERLVQVCIGTACHVAGADRVLDQLRLELGIPFGCDTDPDGRASVETVGCLGCCTRAPVVQVDGATAGHVHVEDVPGLLSPKTCRKDKTPGGVGRAKRVPRQPAVASSPPVEIRIGLGSCCVAGGSRDVMETLQRELRRRRIDATVKPVGCVGVCHLTPMVEVRAAGSEPIVATRATPAEVRRIVRSLPVAAPWPARIVHRLQDLWQPAPSMPPTSGDSLSTCQITPLRHERIEGFTARQVRIVTEHCGAMDPEILEDYREHDGLVALETCLAGRDGPSIIDEIEASGLRGRGGGGFPTARKWSMVAAAEGDKFLVCNGDEGDPGAFMDRMIMESYPYRVLEGMAIAAYAVGASRAIVYVRHEYPLAVQRLRHAIAEMTGAGLLGERIAGSEFSLQVEIVEGAGAFVCGEETALLESIMGRRGTPQHRPPYPAERGLWQRPTLVNNVETFANVPWILRHGAARFAALGTDSSKGTKVFSLAGKVRRGGLIEVPMGLTIRQVVEEIGGGVGDGKRFKAVQIGGPSGGCIPAALADTPIDYEALRCVGAIMGSGGLVVMDDDDCMVDVARYFLEFTQHESCGHCTFCRLGTRRLLEILDRLCTGKGRARDLEEIETLSTHVIAGSLCGLGKTAPNPVLTTLRYFRDEYEAHLAGRCPAGRCKALIRYRVTRDCVGCTICAQRCPVGAIPVTAYKRHVIDADVCTRCDVCRTACPEHAIEVTS